MVCDLITSGLYNQFIHLIIFSQINFELLKESFSKKEKCRKEILSKLVYDWG